MWSIFDFRRKTKLDKFKGTHRFRYYREVSSWTAYALLNSVVSRCRWASSLVISLRILARKSNPRGCCRRNDAASAVDYALRGHITMTTRYRQELQKYRTTQQKKNWKHHDALAWNNRQTNKNINRKITDKNIKLRHTKNQDFKILTHKPETCIFFTQSPLVYVQLRQFMCFTGKNMYSLK